MPKTKGINITDLAWSALESDSNTTLKEFKKLLRLLNVKSSQKSAVEIFRVIKNYHRLEITRSQVHDIRNRRYSVKEDLKPLTVCIRNILNSSRHALTVSEIYAVLVKDHNMQPSSKAITVVLESIDPAYFNPDLNHKVTSAAMDLLKPVSILIKTSEYKADIKTVLREISDPDRPVSEKTLRFAADKLCLKFYPLGESNYVSALVRDWIRKFCSTEKDTVNIHKLERHINRKIKLVELPVLRNYLEKTGIKYLETENTETEPVPETPKAAPVSIDPDGKFISVSLVLSINDGKEDLKNYSFSMRRNRKPELLDWLELLLNEFKRGGLNETK